MSTCGHCGQPLPDAATASVWYMHDNHTFTRLQGSVDECIEQARKLGIESPYGMLGSVILLNENGREIRRIGASVHARNGFDDSDLAKWRDAVLSDVDGCRLLGAARL